jgi:hypothetical protein
MKYAIHYLQALGFMPEVLQLCLQVPVCCCSVMSSLAGLGSSKGS